jgi:hypothetical protein
MGATHVTRLAGQMASSGGRLQLTMLGARQVPCVVPLETATLVATHQMSHHTRQRSGTFRQRTVASAMRQGRSLVPLLLKIRSARCLTSSDVPRQREDSRAHRLVLGLSRQWIPFGVGVEDSTAQPEDVLTRDGA